jgi:hypothetical protein
LNKGNEAMKKKLKKQTDTSPLSSKSLVENRLEKPMQLNAVDNPKSAGKKSKFTLADGTAISSESMERFEKAFKQATGTDDANFAMAILWHVSKGLPDSTFHQRFTCMASLLPTVRPQDETEALLAGQFLALQASAMEYLRQGHFQDRLDHTERYTNLATKLFNAATQTMQALTKYRAKGQQTVQVIHVHNEGQAIVAQNLSSGGGVGT